MQTYTVQAEFASTDRVVKLCGNIRNVRDAREWAAAHVSRDKTRVRAIQIVDNADGRVETVWHRDWTDQSNHAGLYA